MSITIEYNSNNSGGSWWLTDWQWDCLAANWWDVEWGGYSFDWEEKKTRKDAEERRYLWALATRAYRTYDDTDDNDYALAKAIHEFEELTGEEASATGCECCGRPHNFYIS